MSRRLAGGLVLGGLLVGAPMTQAQPTPLHHHPLSAARLQQLCGAQGLAPALVRAVIQVESGGHPSALRINAGEGYTRYPTTPQQAIQILQAVMPLTRNIDIGLMQINWGIWGSRLGIRPTHLLDPATNVRLGCRILRQALATRGPLWQRLGRYHSGRPARQRVYAQRVLAALRRTNPSAAP
jgi:soluble lytic murein transglycosylase-like protein